MNDLTVKLKERIEKELQEMLECDNWDGKKLSWVYQLCNIMKDIHEIEKITKSSE